MKTWTKEDYLAWIASRSKDPSEWDRDCCRLADQLIERETLVKLEQEMRLRCAHKKISDFITLMARAHFGSEEVDEFCLHFNLYPKWMTWQ